MTLLSASEAAERLGIHPSLVRAYLREGRLAAAHRQPWLIDEAELERFEQELRPIGRPKRVSPSAPTGRAATLPTG